MSGQTITSAAKQGQADLATSKLSQASGFLELKIPPPAYLLLGLTVSQLLSRKPASKPRPASHWLGLPLVIAGLGIGVHAFQTFKRKKTTPNPFHPEKATELVDEGTYRFSRNPMYLGSALILAGWNLFRSSLSGLAVVPAYIALVTRFQILPEETHLRRIFGDAYLAYQHRVRRWL